MMLADVNVSNCVCLDHLPVSLISFTLLAYHSSECTDSSVHVCMNELLHTSHFQLAPHRKHKKTKYKQRRKNDILKTQRIKRNPEPKRERAALPSTPRKLANIRVCFLQHRMVVDAAVSSWNLTCDKLYKAKNDQWTP